jgi:hypothetical protein
VARSPTGFFTSKHGVLEATSLGFSKPFFDLSFCGADDNTEKAGYAIV